jgi:hypothetical protein
MSEAAFADWLRNVARVDEPRRIVRRENGRILLSKFEDGFAARLHEALSRVPELFDAAAVSRRLPADDGPPVHVDAWHRAIIALLAELAHDRGLTASQRAEIEAGIDSVAALLDSVLWSRTPGTPPSPPVPAELHAYREAVARMDAEPGIFTRFYGVFEGARVENHCPGAPFARRLFAQAWTICTATPPPA